MTRKKTRLPWMVLDPCSTRMSLACYGCDVEKTVTLEEAVDAGWADIVEAVDDGDLCGWYTHIGWCPACGVPVVEQLELF